MAAPERKTFTAVKEWQFGAVKKQVRDFVDVQMASRCSVIEEKWTVAGGWACAWCTARSLEPKQELGLCSSAASSQLSEVEIRFM